MEIDTQPINSQPNVSNNCLTIVGIVILCIRFVQGWIFWGGGSRRFIYDPSKLDPHAPQWMANKLQSAMPGALLGVGSAINFLLQHFIFLYIAIIGFSLVELLAGTALLLGFFTRLAGFITLFISIFLMLAFGWEGATCMDEWTMAIANLAIGATLALSGASYYSIDNLLIKHYPSFFSRPWISMMTSGPLPLARLKLMSYIYLLFTIVFALLTYNYFRGSIITPYHAGPVNPGEHHITLSNTYLSSNGTLRFNLYVDAGTPAIPSNIIRIELQNSKNNIVETWEGKNLSTISNANIKNVYAYNRVTTGSYGIVAPVSAKAEITLQPTISLHLSPEKYSLIVYTINGHRWMIPVLLSV